MIAGGVHGLGRGEVARRVLTDDDVRTIVQRVIDERRMAATQYDELGRHDDASELRTEIAVLERVVDA